MIMGIIDKQFDYSVVGNENLSRFRQAWIAHAGSKVYVDNVFARFGL